MTRLADLDAVTLDANGTLVGLVDPVSELERELRKRGVEQPAERIRRAFEAEGAVYATRSVESHDPAAFATVQRECTAIFLDEVGANGVTVEEFAPAYVAAMRFEVMPGVEDSLRWLQRRGLELGVVANFDLTLGERLEQLGLRDFFSAVVTPADAGVAKPDPHIFDIAVERLRVTHERTLHVGDGRVDEEGARAAGMHFAWAPLPKALESLA